MKYYTQHLEKAIDIDERFPRLMAITLDPARSYREGIVRVIVRRDGDITIKGYTDTSELYTLASDGPDHFSIGERLYIEGQQELLEKLIPQGWTCIGLEDPDIVRDENGRMHLYFTIPVKSPRKEDKLRIHLGHAEGEDIHSLVMTEPVLLGDEACSAKEVSIAPINKKGLRLNLIESRDRTPETTYSVVQVAQAETLHGPWTYKDIAFHPRMHQLSWIAHHASPGPLISKNIIDVGEGKLLGFINGREANINEDGIVRYGMFSIGLFIYDYEQGRIDWVSEEPYIRDTEATTITFASQWVETGSSSGVLYAHVDDTFVRAYDVTAEGLRAFLQEQKNTHK